jgi:integrase/recombinase XerD
MTQQAIILAEQTTILSAEQHPAAVYLARLAPGSRRAMRQALATIAGLTNHTAESMPWSAVRYQHSQAIRTHLAEHYAPASTNKLLCALRGVLQECYRLGLMTAEDYYRASDVQSVKGSKLLRGRALTALELEHLFSICNTSTPIGARDAALLAVVYGAGLRRSEAVALSLIDYNRVSGAIVVKGKGNKERLVYATNGSRTALEHWLTIRGEQPGALFVPVSKGGKLAFRNLTDTAVLLIFRTLAERAKIAEFSPHDLRRTFISDLLDAGADLSAVQQLAGHSNVSTTARYDRRGERAKVKAASMLHVPFNAP